MVLRRAGLYALFVALYLISTVPVGLFLYSLKTEVGVDIFKHGGYHAYVQCLRQSFPLSDAAMPSQKHQTCRGECDRP
jgi:hypothetical protein